MLALLEMTASEIRFSRQDFKISSYANRIIDKLRDGVELAIMDAVDKSNVTVCPECGVEVQSGACTAWSAGLSSNIESYMTTLTVYKIYTNGI